MADAATLRSNAQALLAFPVSPYTTGHVGLDAKLAHIQLAQGVAKDLPDVWLALLREDAALLRGLRDELLDAALSIYAVTAFDTGRSTAREAAFGLTQCLPGVELTPVQRSKLAAIIGASDETDDVLRPA